MTKTHWLVFYLGDTKLLDPMNLSTSTPAVGFPQKLEWQGRLVSRRGTEYKIHRGSSNLSFLSPASIQPLLLPPYMYFGSCFHRWSISSSACPFCVLAILCLQSHPAFLPHKICWVTKRCTSYRSRADLFLRQFAFEAQSGNAMTTAHWGNLLPTSSLLKHLFEETSPCQRL